MDTINYGNRMETKLIAWIDAFIKILSWRGSEESENVLTKTRDLNVHRTESAYRIGKLDGVLKQEWNARAKGIDNGYVEVRGK